MGIKLNIKKLNDVLAVMKTVNDKNARLIIQPIYDTNTLVFFCIQTEYAVMMTYEDAEGLSKETLPTILNISLADLTGLVGLADSKAQLEMTALRNGEYMTLRVLLMSEGEDALSINHDIPAYDEAQNKRSALGQINFEILDGLTYENALEAENHVIALPRMSTISSITKCLLTDNTQIILSAQAQAYATCGSRYAVYITDSNLGLTATLNVNHAKALCAAFKTIEADNLLCLVDNNQLFISDDKNQLYIQMSLPIAKKNIVQQINGFNTADYSEHQTTINKKLLLDGLKAFNVLWHEPQISITLSDGKLIINNTISFAALTEDPSAVTYQLNLQTLQSMLQSLTTQYIHMSTTPAVETTDENNAAETQQLLRLAEVTENGTLGTKVYSII